MQFSDTPIPGVKIFTPRLWPDERGYFFESYNAKVFEEAGIAAQFVQDNQARSTYGVARGLHYQVGEHAQAKLVRCLKGEVLDVVLDLRPDSPTYGQHYGVLLSEENLRQLFVPRGLAHGYVVLSEVAVFFYKCDNFYHKGAEGGVLLHDPALGIDWGIPPEAMLLSDKDRALPPFGGHRL